MRGLHRMIAAVLVLGLMLGMGWPVGADEQWMTLKEWVSSLSHYYEDGRPYIYGANTLKGRVRIAAGETLYMCADLTISGAMLIEPGGKLCGRSATFGPARINVEPGARLINNGTISCGVSNMLVIEDGAHFEGAGGVIIHYGSDGIRFETASKAIYAGNISGDGDEKYEGVLKMSGVGTLILSGHNTHLGHTFIEKGTLMLTGDNKSGVYHLEGEGATLQIGAGGNNAGGSIAGDVVFEGQGDGKQLVFDQLGNHSHHGTISGKGSLTKKNSGFLTLTAANSYTGDTTVSQGMLILEKPFTSAAGRTLTVGAGAALLAEDTLSVNGSLVVRGLIRSNHPLDKAGVPPMVFDAGEGEFAPGVKSLYAYRGEASPIGVSKIHSGPVREGYDFRGWVDAKGNPVPEQIIPGTTAYANWRIASNSPGGWTMPKRYTGTAGVRHQLVEFTSGGETAALTVASNRPKVATVDEDGRVRCLKPGTATITVSDATGAKLSCKLTVKKNAFSRRKSEAVPAGELGVSVKHLGYKRGELVVKLFLNNRTGRKIAALAHPTLELLDADQVVYARAMPDWRPKKGLNDKTTKVYEATGGLALEQLDLRSGRYRARLSGYEIEWAGQKELEEPEREAPVEPEAPVEEAPLADAA